jgi:hypothetical protein
MTRIFLGLACFAFALLAINLFLGLSIGDYNGSAATWRKAIADVRAIERTRPKRDDPELLAARDRQQQANQAMEPMRGRVRAHWLFGLAAALVTVLVNSVTVTYFIGTSRWCKEVCEAYSLDPELAARCLRLKRRTFPWAFGGIMAILGIVALGASSEPGNSMSENPAAWVDYHFLAAFVGLAFIGGSFLRQATSIQTNYALIQSIMEEVRRVRSGHGLESETAEGVA